MAKKATAMPVRRRFLLAGGASLAAVAMPQVSRAQTVNWRFQSSWAQKDIFHEFAINRPSHLDWRGLLLLSTEIMMFGIPTLFVFVGLLEQMIRARAGIPRARDFGFAPPAKPMLQAKQIER